jgi:hypothetical protein
MFINQLMVPHDTTLYQQSRQGSKQPDLMSIKTLASSSPLRQPMRSVTSIAKRGSALRQCMVDHSASVRLGRLMSD